jgi:hypothetical protein
MTAPVRSGVVLRRTVRRRVAAPTVCAECGTGFDGIACPECGELVEARPVGQLGVVVEAGDGRSWLVLAVRGQGGRWHPTRCLAASEEAVRMLARQTAEGGPVEDSEEPCERCAHGLFAHSVTVGCWCGCTHGVDRWGLDEAVGS